MSDPSRDLSSPFYVCRCPKQHRHRLACWLWRQIERLERMADDNLWGGE